MKLNFQFFRFDYDRYCMLNFDEQNEVGNGIN